MTVFKKTLRGKPTEVGGVQGIPQDEVVFLDQMCLVHHPFNPRGVFDFTEGTDEWTELTTSIKASGILVPVQVARIGDHLRPFLKPDCEDGEWVIYQNTHLVIISGHRRYEVQKKINPKTYIKSLITRFRSKSPIEEEMKALVAANAGFKAPSVVQKAKTYRSWVALRMSQGKKGDMTNAGIAEVFGMSESAARRMRKVADFPKEVWAMFDAKNITEKAVDIVQKVLDAGVAPKTVAAELRKLASDKKLSFGPIKDAMKALLPSKDKDGKSPEQAAAEAANEDGTTDPSIPTEESKEEPTVVTKSAVAERVAHFTRAMHAKHGFVQHSPDGIRVKKEVAADVVFGVSKAVASGRISPEQAASYFMDSNIYVTNDCIGDLLDLVEEEYKKAGAQPFTKKFSGNDE